MWNNLFSPEMLVGDVLAQWPQLVPLFLAKRMSCIGCSMNRFEDLRDISRIYGIDLQAFLAEMERVVQAPNSPI